MQVKPGHKVTERGTIPQDWELRPLLSVLRVASGQADPRIEPYRSMILVAPDHIQSATGRLLAKETASDQNAISGKYVFEAGDIVYSKIRPYLRKAILADFGGLCSADMYPLKPAAGVSGGLMLAILLGHSFSKYAESVSVRSGMPKINRAELSEYTVALPATSSEQRSIAQALSDADALIESLDQLIAKKRQLKQAAMQQLLTGKTRLPGFGAEWEKRTLGELGKWRGGMTPSMSNPAFWNPPTIPWISSGDVKADRLTTTGYSISDYAAQKGATTLIPADCVITVMRSGILRKYLPVASNTVPMAINQDIKALVPSRTVSPAYIQQSLKHHGEEILARCLKSGTTVESLEFSWLKAFEIPLPRLEEQLQIASVLCEMDDEIATLDSKREKARQLKQGMMQELLTGRIRLI